MSALCRRNDMASARQQHRQGYRTQIKRPGANAGPFPKRTSAIRRRLVALSSQFGHCRQPWRSRLRSPVAISGAVCANSALARGSKHSPDCDPVSQRTASTSFAHFHGVAQTRRNCRFGSSPAETLCGAHTGNVTLGTELVGASACQPQSRIPSWPRS